MASSKSQDTEITLDVGKMLALFFGLVALCAVFFGLGFSTGRKSAGSAQADPGQSTTLSGSVRPSALKTTANSTSSLSFYKSEGASETSSQQAAKDQATSSDTTPTEEAKAASVPDPALPVATSGYFVQVAAVSKQEDAEALVDALKKKQYPALIANATDKLFHVQVGPYADIKEAEGMRAKLVSDGYNPILKK